MTELLNSPGELFLGSDIRTAQAMGPRQFRSSAKAVRFAMEQVAPVSLRGAMLKIAGQTFGPEQIKRMHDDLISERKKIRGF